MMHRWTDVDGRSWECDEYDHGPFCRLCRLVEPANPKAEAAATPIIDTVAPT